MEKHNLSLMQLNRMMHEVYRVIRKQFDEQQIEEIKLSMEQFGLLHAINIKEEEVIQKDMAEIMGKDKSAILRLIDSLEEKELVRRVSDVKDRRKNYLMVTKTGNRVLEQYKKVAHDLMEEIQQGITQDELDTFNKVVLQIKSKAETI